MEKNKIQIPTFENINEDEEIEKKPFKILGKLGGGVYGKVYNAITENNDHVAIKRNIIPKFYNGSAYNIRELGISYILGDHPFCTKFISYHYGCPYHDRLTSPNEIDMTNDQLYLVTEKLDTDLETILHDKTKNIKLSIADKKRLMIQLLLAIEYMHAHDIYHRDLKPSNILLKFKNENDSELECCKITDFGLAQFYTIQTMATYEVVTPLYRGPEVELCKHHNKTIDIWSLGCIFFELFSKNNIRFNSTKDKYKFMDFLLTTRIFPADDYLLAKKLFGDKINLNYEKSQTNILPITTLLGLYDKEIEKFNAKEIDGKLNHGYINNMNCSATYANFIHLINGMLEIDIEKRLTASQCIEHPFFEGYRELIDYTRAKFDIDNTGQWVTKPIIRLEYKNNEVRKHAMEQFIKYYNMRDNVPVYTWYTHQILFHAIDLFDRYNKYFDISINIDRKSLNIMILSLIFLTAKYFSILTGYKKIDDYNIDFKGSEMIDITKRVNEFEEKIIKEVYDGQIYIPTLYETAIEQLSEAAINKIVNDIVTMRYTDNTPLNDIWAILEPEIQLASKTEISFEKLSLFD